MAESILIIDDQLANLQLLAKMLEREGYIVRPVTNGETAVATARLDPPDLILLDINMPGMDGYEVCQELKKYDVLKEIPVVFLTASDQTVDKVRAFSAGGADYITKPFNLEEIKVRIKTHLTINIQKRNLQLKTEQLEAGYARLNELEKLKDDLVHMIVHDMRNMVQRVTGYLELLGVYRGQSLDERQRHYIAHALESTNDLKRMMNSLLDKS
ncbi:MAG: response regulator [Syntrophorhabdaceae bacterium]